MARQTTIRESIASLIEQNKAQTKSIDRMYTELRDHTASSEGFRDKAKKSETDIIWIKIIGGGLFTLIGTLIWIIKG